MERRQFLKASAAVSGLAVTRGATAQGTPAAAGREYYQIRKYGFVSGPQNKMTEKYFAEALIPALGKMGMGPVGAFSVVFGPETPTYYLLIPGSSAQALAEIDLHLSKDEAFVKAADAFWNATAAAPAFVRVESSLLSAFEGWPKLTPPPASATKAKRIFQLRTYESPSNGEHVRKVEMFNSGEFGIFVKAGCRPVFFADTLISQRMPSLTYMLSFDDQAGLEAGWKQFSSDPEWKKLTADPRYAYDQIVSNITNLILSPLSCSQI
jgi:hypothetical protein